MGPPFVTPNHLGLSLHQEAPFTLSLACGPFCAYRTHMRLGEGGKQDTPITPLSSPAPTLQPRKLGTLALPAWLSFSLCWPWPPLCSCIHYGTHEGRTVTYREGGPLDAHPGSALAPPFVFLHMSLPVLFPEELSGCYHHSYRCTLTLAQLLIRPYASGVAAASQVRWL